MENHPWVKQAIVLLAKETLRGWSMFDANFFSASSSSSARCAPSWAAARRPSIEQKFSARRENFSNLSGAARVSKVKPRAAKGKEGGARLSQQGFFIGKALRPARGAAP
jgi:hypothetical protein